MRTALGASALRIVRQLLTESLVLAALGTACGLALAYGSIAMLVRWPPVELRGLDQVAIDASVLAFTASIAFISALGFGILCGAGGATARRSDHSAARATAGRSASRQLGRDPIGVVLLVGAGLLLGASTV